MEERTHVGVPIIPGGGVDVSKAGDLIGVGIAIDALNIEFDEDSMQKAGGARKVLGRGAKRPGAMMRPTEFPMRSDNGSVPARGYAFLGYDEQLDLGGDFATDGTGILTEVLHTRRQLLDAWTINVRFRLPEDTALFDIDQRAAAAPAVGTELAGLDDGWQFDECLDHCIVLWQKGGDRTSPMSAFVGIVNVGQAFEGVTEDFDGRQSNYALCFGWYDAPGWGRNEPTRMRYKVGVGEQAAVGSTGTTCSMAMRVLVFPLFIEPGMDYAAAISIQLDSGSPHFSGAVNDPTAFWSDDGRVSCALSELRYGAEGAVAVSSAPYVWKGPTDSLDYLKRYGVRFSGRDAMFLGLGLRNVTSDPLGWPAVGFDSSSMEKGGHIMTPLGDTNIAALGFAFGANHTLATDAFIDISSFGFGGVGDGSMSYHSPDGRFTGLYDGTVITNPEALRGYYLVFGLEADADLRGARLRIGTYEVAAGPTPRINLLDAPATFPAFSGLAHTLQCLRWKQVAVVFDEFSIYASAPDYQETGSRGLARRMTLAGGSYTTIGDPDTASLLASWPIDDGDGGRLRESVSNRDGALVPYSSVSWPGGTRGDERLFLSGEGEALMLDLSEDPVFQREFRRMATANEGGVSIQVTMTIPEAHYAILDGSSGEFVGRYAPCLMSWESREHTEDLPLPLMRLSHQGRTALTERYAFWGPQGFTLEVLQQADQQATELKTIVSTTNAAEWGVNAPWVGRTITVQIGIEATGTPDEFRCYVAVSPKELFVPEDGEPGNLELAYHQTLTLSRREIVRSVVTIGGQFHPRGASWSELGCRMWIDEVHVLGSPAPGLLATSGTANMQRSGKLVGGNALPRGPLTRRDLLFDLGPGLRSVSVVRGDRTVSTPSALNFYRADASASLEGLVGAFIVVQGDTSELRITQSSPLLFNELYQVESVGTGSLELRTPYNGPSRSGAAAAQVRHLGYTAFQGLARGDFNWTIGAGPSYGPASTIEDALLTGAIVPNVSPFAGVWRMRVFRVAGDQSSLDVSPKWVRGCRTAMLNRLSGGVSLTGDVYVGGGSCFYRLDPRWRPMVRDGIEGYALAFLGSGEFPNAPLDGDVAVSTEFDHEILPNLEAGEFWRLDFEATLDDIGGLQTVAWVGNTHGHPAFGGTALWVRFCEGRPELCLGSTETFNGVDQAERLLFTATTRQALRLGERTQVRWELDGDGASLGVPRCWVDGNEIAVRLLSAGNGAGEGRWLLNTGLLGDANTFALGAARDWPLSSTRQGLLSVGVLGGNLLHPTRRAGWLHSLRGALAGFVVDIVSVASDRGYDGLARLDGPSSQSVLYIGLHLGHGAILSVHGGHELVLHANPFLGLTYGHGDRNRPWSMATWGNRIFATGGGRPLVYDTRRDLLRPVGMVRPTNAPTFEIRRRALWVRNVQDGTSSADPFPVLNDGLVEDIDAAEPLYHYSTFGNAYLEQPTDESMRWERNDSGSPGVQNDIFAFKCLFMLRSVTGRNPILEARSSTDNGSYFVEIRDGRLVFGWYDTDLKAEALIEVAGELVEPGVWFYLFVKKVFPLPTEEGWSNSIWAQGTNVHRDSLVLRRLVSSGEPGAPPPNDGPIDAKPTLHAVDWAADTYHCISFTTVDAVDTHADFTAKGRVTGTGFKIDVTPTTGNSATFAIGATSYATPLHSDMHGMFIQWHDGARARLGRITRCLPAGPTFALVTIDGLGAPDAETDVVAAVCIGTRLEINSVARSGNAPDTSLYPIRILGSALALSVLTGIQPVSGEIGSFGYVVVREDQTTPGAPGSNPLIFHNDASAVMEIGTDTFGGSIVAPIGNEPGDLLFEAAGVNNSVVQSTQPNDALEVELDAAVSAIGAQSLRWKLLQPVQLLDGARRISVTFYDPETDSETGPGPELVVDPSADDTANGSAQSSILLKGLPVSPDGDFVWRRVYVTLADGVIPQLVAEIPDNISGEIEIDVDEEDISNGQPQQQFQRPPLRCGIVAVVANRLILAAVDGNEDLLWYSEAFSPDRIPIDNFASFASGPQSAITGVAELAGRAIIFKRNRYIASALLTDGAVTQRQISDSRGCIGHNTIQMVEDSLVWIDSSGVCVMTQGSQPRLISPELRQLFLERVQHAQLGWACAASNNQRRQYVCTLPFKDAAPRIDKRITAELRRTTADSGIQSSSWRFGILGDPALVCMVEVDDEFGGPERLVGFDEYGFAWDLDQRETSRVGSGEAFLATEDSDYGVEGDDLFFEAQLASIARGQLASLAGNYARVLAASGDAVLLDGDPIGGGNSTIGVQRYSWSSRWMDFDAPEREKTLKRLDIYFSEDSFPSLVRVRLYVNRGAPQLFYENINVNSRGVALLSNVPSGCWRHVQVVIDLPMPVGSSRDVTDAHFEVTKIVFLVEDQDPA